LSQYPRFENLGLTLLDDGVLEVVLDRPPVNAITVAMYKEIHRLFSDIDLAGPNVRVAILSGAGKHFSAGNDLDEFETMDPENGRERMFHVREAFFAIRECAVPVVAAVSGSALGTGVALAASCDFIVASEDAKFALPELSVGVMGGAKHLARLVPEPVVRWMFFTGTRIDAAELRARGGVIEVVPREELRSEAQRVARQVAAHSPTAVRLAKRGLNDIEFLDTRRGYELEQRMSVSMSGHPDSKEALSAARRGGVPTYAPLRGPAGLAPSS
jgi:enoyl-CoA hydratase/carnithine racemase